MGTSRIIAPSILSADFSRLGEEIKNIEAGGADWVHVDVMDGHYVPNITIGPVVVQSIRKVTRLPFDVHLMIDDADRYIPEFAKAGADIITVHEESCVHLHRTLTMIRDLGKKVGVSLNPSTPVDTLTDVIHLVDLVLVMSVNPGFGGQKFIPESVSKVEKLAQLRKERGLKFLIEIDGGVSELNSGMLAKAGVDAFVAGSAIFSQKDYKKAIEGIRNGK